MPKSDLSVHFLNLMGLVSELDDALGPLDERLGASPVAEGLRASVDFAEVAAIALSDGDLIDPDDLLLHDAQMDGRPPTRELAMTRRLSLTARHSAGTGDPHDHMTRKGLRRLARLPEIVGGQGSPSPGDVRADIDALLRLAADLERPSGEQTQGAVEDLRTEEQMFPAASNDGEAA